MRTLGFLLCSVTTLAIPSAAFLSAAEGQRPEPQWQRKIEIGSHDVAGELAAAKLDSTQSVNWFVGRWPYISFLGGMVMGNRLFNHGNIVIGCDRLDPAQWRVSPPEPLFTTPRGPYHGTIEFRPDRLGLDSSVDYALYEVSGIDGQAMEGVISGHKTFTVKDIPFQSHGGVIRAAVKVDKRAQYVIARRGEAH